MFYKIGSVNIGDFALMTASRDRYQRTIPVESPLATIGVEQVWQVLKFLPLFIFMTFLSKSCWVNAL